MLNMAHPRSLVKFAHSSSQRAHCPTALSTRQKRLLRRQTGERLPAEDRMLSRARLRIHGLLLRVALLHVFHVRTISRVASRSSVE